MLMTILVLTRVVVDQPVCSAGSGPQYDQQAVDRRRTTLGWACLVTKDRRRPSLRLPGESASSISPRFAMTMPESLDGVLRVWKRVFAVF